MLGNKHPETVRDITEEGRFNLQCLKSEHSQPLSYNGRTSPVSIVTQTQGLLNMQPK